MSLFEPKIKVNTRIFHLNCVCNLFQNKSLEQQPNIFINEEQLLIYPQVIKIFPKKRSLIVIAQERVEHNLFTFGP